MKLAEQLEVTMNDHDKICCKNLQVFRGDMTA